MKCSVSPVLKQVTRVAGSTIMDTLEDLPPGIGQYDDFHTIDWLRDVARDRMRHRQVVKKKQDGCWESLKGAHDAWSGWMVVLLVGVSTGRSPSSTLSPMRVWCNMLVGWGHCVWCNMLVGWGHCVWCNMLVGWGHCVRMCLCLLPNNLVKQFTFDLNLKFVFLLDHTATRKKTNQLLN